MNVSIDRGEVATFSCSYPMNVELVWVGPFDLMQANITLNQEESESISNLSFIVDNSYFAGQYYCQTLVSGFLVNSSVATLTVNCKAKNVLV